MSRLKKEVTINDRRIVINELTVKEIRLFWGEPLDKLMGDVGDILIAMKPFFEAAVEGLPFDQLEDYTPSELKVIFDAFMEVNKSFFDAAKVLEGEHPFIIKLRQSIVAELMVRFVNFYVPATKGSGTMDGVSSPSPSNTTTDAKVEITETSKP